MKNVDYLECVLLVYDLKCELEKLTKLLDASTKKMERKKRKVRGFQLRNLYIISASL